jgi:hypothetical protein
MDGEALTGDLSISEGVSEIERLMNAPPEPAAPEVGDPPAQIEQSQAEPEAPKPDAPVQAEATPGEGVETFTVKVNGEAIKVTKDELLSGYSRTQDYTAKTEAVAAERREAQALKERYASGINQMVEVLQSSAPKPPALDLLDSNPVEYLRQKALFDEGQSQLAQYRAEQTRLAEEAQRESAAQMHARLQAEQQALLAKVPEWKDEAKATAEKQQLRKFLESTGYKPEEIDGVADSRAIVIARKAMLFDQLIAQQQQAAKVVEKLPPKVERPGVSGSGNLDRRTEAFQRLQRTGNFDDGVAAVASLLG